MRRPHLTALALLAGVSIIVQPGVANSEAPTGCLLPGIDDRCEAWESRFSQNIRETPSDLPGPWRVSSSDTGARAAVNSRGTVAFVNGQNVDWPSDCQDQGWLSDRIQTVAYDLDSGAVLWHNQIHAPDCSWTALGRGIAVSADDSAVFVVGVAAKGNASDVLVHALDAETGHLLWQTQYDGAFGGQDDAFDLVASPDGNSIMVAASEQVSSLGVAFRGASRIYQHRELSTWMEGDVDVSLLTFDASSGTLLDRDVVGGETFKIDGVDRGSWDHALDIAIAADGSHLAISAAMDGKESYRDLRPHVAVLGFDAAGSGWTHSSTYRSPGSPLGLERAADGYVLSGLETTQSKPDSPYSIALISEGGDARWSTLYEVGPKSGAPRGLAVDPVRGTIAATGLESSRGSALSVLVLEASTGETRWSSFFRDPRTSTTVVFNYDQDQMPYVAVDSLTGDIRLTHLREAGKTLRTVSLDGMTGMQEWVGLHHYPERAALEDSTQYPYPRGIATSPTGHTLVYGTVFVQLRDQCRYNAGAFWAPFPCTRDDLLAIAFAP